MGNSEEGVETRRRGKLQTRARAGAQSVRRDATSSVDGTDPRLLPSASTPLPPRRRHGQPLASIPTTDAVVAAAAARPRRRPRAPRVPRAEVCEHDAVWPLVCKASKDGKHQYVGHGVESDWTGV